MAKTQILEYTIFLRDAAVVASLQASIQAGTPPVMAPGLAPTPLVRLPTGGYGLALAPYYAGINGDVAVGGDGVLPLPQIEVGQARPLTGPGYLTSGWFNTSNDFPRTLYTFSKSTGWWIFGHTTKFIWGGRVALAPSMPVTGPGTPSPELPGGEIQWAFLQGEPVFYSGEKGYDNSLDFRTNIRGRVPGAGRGGGIGYRFASNSNNQQHYINFDSLHNVNPPLVSGGSYLRSVWQRLYFRPQKYGTATTPFWAIYTNASFGFSLGITAGGQFALYADFSKDSTLLLTSFGQTTLAQWTRLDLFCHLPDPPTSGLKRMEARVNGVPVAEVEYTDGVFGQQPDRHWAQTYIGLGWSSSHPVTTHIWEIDDWICAKTPPTLDANLPVWNAGTAYAIGALVRHAGLTYSATAASTGQAPSGVTSPYWTLVAEPAAVRGGLHLVQVGPNGFGPGHSGWTEDWRTLAQPAVLVSGNAYLQSSVANAPLVATLPMATAVDALPGSLGWVAARVCVAYSKNGPALPLAYGYQVGADPEVLVTALTIGSPVLTSHTQQSFNLLLPASRAAEPQRGVPLTLRVNKGNDALPMTVAQLQATVLCLGTFGPEDEPGTLPVPPVTTHLWHHPDTPWSQQTLPLGPILVIGLTYVGNGTGQDLLFKLPLTWWMIRKVDAFGGPYPGHWWTPLVAGHQGYQASSFCGGASTAGQVRDYTFVPTSPDADQQLQFPLRIVGASEQHFNALGSTYQVIAFCDPAARFTRGFATKFSPLGTPAVLPLEDPAFLADVAFIGPEVSGGTAIPDMAWKMPGHAADAVQVMWGTPNAPIANALTFGTGTVTIGPGLVTSTGTGDVELYGGLLWRRADGNNHPDQARVFFTGSYVGDAAASRTIGLPPVGRRPLFAQVQSVVSGAAAYHRDPSHLTTMSSPAGTSGDLGTAITGGGIDSFSVGTTLNTNGVTFNYFGFFAGTAAGNNGWGTNGEYVPLPADSSSPPDWQEPEIIEPGDGGNGGEPEPEPDDETDPGDIGDDVAANCVNASTRLVNLALSSIGSADAVVHLGTEASRQAETARLHYRTEIDAVLRAHVWKFATRYATLTPLSGSLTAPVSGDWTFRYRLPADCLLVRRIVPPDGRQRQFDPAPVPFDTTDDFTETAGGGVVGGVLATNAEAVEIEYTARIFCPARVRDPIFRRACTWRLAHCFAAPLGRDKAQATQAYQLYRLQILEAQARDQNEQQAQNPDHLGEAEWIRARDGGDDRFRDR